MLLPCNSEIHSFLSFFLSVFPFCLFLPLNGFVFHSSSVFECVCIGVLKCVFLSLRLSVSSSRLALNQQWQVGQHQNSVAHCLMLRLVRSLLQLNWTEDEGEKDVKREIKRRGGRWGIRVLKQAYILHESPPPPPHPFLHRMAVYCSGLINSARWENYF